MITHEKKVNINTKPRRLVAFAALLSLGTGCAQALDEEGQENADQAQYTDTDSEDGDKATTQGITRFVLINAATDKDLGLLASGATISLAEVGTSLNVRADFAGSVGAVKFDLDQIIGYRTESAAPYALAGNSGTNYYSWTPALGSHTLTARPTTGTPLTIGFTVVATGTGGIPDGGTTGGTPDGGTTGGTADGGTADGGTTGGTTGTTQRVTFVRDDTTDFLNPERGWMRRGNDSTFAAVRGGDTNHPVGYSVVWTDVGGPGWDGTTGNPFRLDNYRTQNLPNSLLTRLGQVFDKARSAGIKLKVRFAYNYDSTGYDATKAQMLTHISQIGPVLTANADAVASMDTGFIGKWGEMHGSVNIPNDQAGEIVRAVLKATPSWMNVGVRYPRVVRSMFGDPGYKMDLALRFSGSDQSRVGWYNDCLWSNKGNTGTYSTGSDASFALDRNTFETVGRFAATSGESCDVGDGLNQYNYCTGSNGVLTDMAKVGGPDTLFRGYWATMYDNWKSQGCYDEVSRRLGYRLSLVSATLPVKVKAGQTFSVSLEITNTGFGKVSNPRPLDLLFVGSSGTTVARLTGDARQQFPLAGETKAYTWTVTAPSTLVTGSIYKLSLRLPDPSARLASDSRYAIRLANQGGIWNATTSSHDLQASVQAE